MEEHQPMVFLKYNVTEETGASNLGQRSTFGIGEGRTTTELIGIMSLLKLFGCYGNNILGGPMQKKEKLLPRECFLSMGGPMHVVFFSIRVTN